MIRTEEALVFGTDVDNVPDTDDLDRDMAELERDIERDWDIAWDVHVWEEEQEANRLARPVTTDDGAPW